MTFLPTDSFLIFSKNIFEKQAFKAISFLPQIVFIEKTQKTCLVSWTPLFQLLSVTRKIKNFMDWSGIPKLDSTLPSSSLRVITKPQFSRRGRNLRVKFLGWSWKMKEMEIGPQNTIISLRIKVTVFLLVWLDWFLSLFIILECITSWPHPPPLIQYIPTIVSLPSTLLPPPPTQLPSPPDLLLLPFPSERAGLPGY